MADKSYTELVEAIIMKQAGVLGSGVAIRRARNVAGIEVSDDGKVTALPTNIVPALQGLVDQYKALSGNMGAEFCREASSMIRQKYPDIQLPAILA